MCYTGSISRCCLLPLIWCSLWLLNIQCKHKRLCCVFVIMVLQSSTRVYLESEKAFHSYSDTHKIFQFENSIQAQEGHSIQIELLDAELPISFYPVNSNNNQIHMFQQPPGSLYNEIKTIPPGQYTATSMATWLTANLTNMSVVYIPGTNKSKPCYRNRDCPTSRG